MYYEDDYDYYDEDSIIIENALDIYDEYEVSMEEAIDIAMEITAYLKDGNDSSRMRGKKFSTIGGSEMKKAKLDYDSGKISKSEYLIRHGAASDKDKAMRSHMQYAKALQGADRDSELNFRNNIKDRVGNYGFKAGSKGTSVTSVKYMNDSRNASPVSQSTISSSGSSRRIDPRAAAAVGAGAAIGAAGLALYRRYKRKLAEKAKKKLAEREAKEAYAPDEKYERKQPKKGVPVLPLVGAGVVGGGAYALHKRRKGTVSKRERQLYEAGLREYGNAIRREYGNPVPIIPMQYEEEDEVE